MAHNNVEVEIKIKLTKSKFEKIKQKLVKIAKLVKTSHHVDEYYNPIYKSFLKPKNPFEWLTIRERDGKVKLNYKHWYPEGAKNTTHCDEYETEVTDIVQMQKILKALHFENFVTVDKKRVTYEYKNELEIALDEVKKLGYFIEVESINNTGGVKKAHEKLLEFLQKELGIIETKTVPGGYGAEMMRKINK
jgi:adenylate cyclase class 2